MSNMVVLEESEEERLEADSSGSPSNPPGEMHMTPRDENNTLFKLFWLTDGDPRVTNISGAAPFIPQILAAL